ncbi:carbohydrate kinase [Streptomyces sp. MB09-02B]|uniref:carbohydrate kinase family protein n=1 Tax=Streptomyces sp. MB09-02B TaxID=3028667 RepID=UPI0029BE25F6|nr:carbohydrate kinase [Streptomyces sp. MB09-02B]MDX3645784.1 carbohydrate kinase [Streptomyces sp. MB09-02B]
MTASPRAVVIGESLVDLVWHTGADVIRPLPGGSPANVAIGLHRLGHPVTLITSWGDDLPGTLVSRHLSVTGLDVLRVPAASGRTTVAVAYVDSATGSATYDFLAAWDPAHIPIGPDTVVLHTGSLAVVVEPGATQVLRACEQLHGRPGRVVAADLNVRPAVQPDRAAYRVAVERLAGVADVVKASDEDLAWLWPEHDPAESARALLGHGPRLVVLTRGPQGAVGFSADAEVSVAAPRTSVIDTIGAGDAFQSALLASLLGPHPDGTDAAHVPTGGQEVERVLRQCVMAGALATTRAGAQPPTLDELRTASFVRP